MSVSDPAPPREQQGAESAFDSILEHVQRIRAKRARLLQAEHDAELALFEQVRALRPGLLDAAEMYDAFRVDASPGFSSRWTQALPRQYNAGALGNYLRDAALYRQNGPNGLGWQGAWPVDRGPRPPNGCSVVYVLFDPDHRPCYVGSSRTFRARLKRHVLDGKPVASWLAYPCPDREAAYELEVELLRTYKPYLNVKVGR